MTRAPYIAGVDLLDADGVALFCDLRRRGFRMTMEVEGSRATLFVSPCWKIDADLEDRISEHGAQLVKLLELNRIESLPCR